MPDLSSDLVLVTHVCVFWYRGRECGGDAGSSLGLEARASAWSPLRLSIDLEQSLGRQEPGCARKGKGGKNGSKICRGRSVEGWARRLHFFCRGGPFPRRGTEK